MLGSTNEHHCFEWIDVYFALIRLHPRRTQVLGDRYRPYGRSYCTDDDVIAVCPAKRQKEQAPHGNSLTNRQLKN